MNKKVTLDLEPTSGMLYDASGAYVATTTLGQLIKSFETEVDNNLVVELMKLGATPDEIIKLKHNGVIK